MVSGNVAPVQQSSPYTKKYGYENLSPTAKKMYKKLKFAIREKT
jgi:hypothetical protein